MIRNFRFNGSAGKLVAYVSVVIEEPSKISGVLLYGQVVGIGFEETG